MPNNITPRRTPEVQRLVNEFQSMLEHYENACRRQRLEGRFVETVERTLYDMTKYFQIMKLGCPPDHEICPHGNCVRRGRVCMCE